MTRTITRRHARESTGTKGLLGMLALGAAALLGGAGSAQAGGAPDFGHYCRAHHGAQAQASFRRDTGQWACIEQRGFARRHYRVDYAAACQLTYGAGGFRRAGPRVVCGDTTARVGNRDGGTPSRRAGDRGFRQVIPNLSGYCRRTFGRLARVAFDRGTGLYACVAARTRRGGIALRPIDMAAACYFTVRSTNFRFDGNRREIRCLVSV